MQFNVRLESRQHVVGAGPMRFNVGSIDRGVLQEHEVGYPIALTSHRWWTINPYKYSVLTHMAFLVDCYKLLLSFVNH